MAKKDQQPVNSGPIQDALSCLDEALSKATTTREKILLSAFAAMHEHGFQGMRIEHVLQATGLAKGALYHHFANKMELGYAVVDEVILPMSKELYEGLLEAEDPIQKQIDIFRLAARDCGDMDISMGCPVNNLAQEMSGLDEGFSKRLVAVYEAWTHTISEALQNGQKRRLVRQDIDTEATAIFIISSVQGVLGTAKCMRSKDILLRLTDVLCTYLESLRYKEQP